MELKQGYLYLNVHGPITFTLGVCAYNIL